MLWHFQMSFKTKHQISWETELHSNWRTSYKRHRGIINRENELLQISWTTKQSKANIKIIGKLKNRGKVKLNLFTFLKRPAFLKCPAKLNKQRKSKTKVSGICQMSWVTNGTTFKLGHMILSKLKNWGKVKLILLTILKCSCILKCPSTLNTQRKSKCPEQWNYIITRTHVRIFCTSIIVEHDFKLILCPKWPPQLYEPTNGKRFMSTPKNSSLHYWEFVFSSRSLQRSQTLCCGYLESENTQREAFAIWQNQSYEPGMGKTKMKWLTNKYVNTHMTLWKGTIPENAR
jgi:hypothetical protein